MEIELGQRCPRKDEPRYKRTKHEDEVAWRDSVYVCAVRRSIGVEGEWNCPDCGFYPPLFIIKRR